MKKPSNLFSSSITCDFHLYGERDLKLYMKDDWITNLLNEHSHKDCEALTCQRWLRELPVKRMVIADLYGSLLRDHFANPVVDVGGGLTAFTKILSRNGPYHLVDPLVHDTDGVVERVVQSLEGELCQQDDWWSANTPNDSIIIANDIFPNVDQRLFLFIQKMSGLASEIRLLLTFSNSPLFFKTKRVDADEHLTMLAWDGEQLMSCLRRLGLPVAEAEQQNAMIAADSLYRNGRQIARLCIKFHY